MLLNCKISSVSKLISNYELVGALLTAYYLPFAPLFLKVMASSSRTYFTHYVKFQI